MWCKIMKNVDSPAKIYEFKQEELTSFYYSILPYLGTPIVEVVKPLNNLNTLEDCAINLIKEEVQIHIFQGEEIIRMVKARMDRFALFENAEKKIEERIYFNVIEEL